VSLVIRRCPLCEFIPKHSGMTKDHSRKLEVDCLRCGRYRISDEAGETLPPGEKHLLSYVCRTWSGEDIPDILTTNMQALIKRAPLVSIPEKRDWLLELVAKNTPTAGDDSAFDFQTDYPLVTASGVNEAEWLRDSLLEAGLLGSGKKGHSNTSCVLTMRGWEYLSQLRREGSRSAFVFVAMSFSSAMSGLFDGAIEPAVRQAGYEPFRVDRKEHTNSIDDEIVGIIHKSRFMVADFTGQRAGVYFEAGMMTGLGRNVIWMCDGQELNKVHFDVRQRNFINWESQEDARQRLFKRILAIEGEGPNIGGAASPRVPGK
jgi:hypothetical protein